MGAWYSVDGELTVKNTPEVRRMVKELSARMGGDFEVVRKSQPEKGLSVTICGGTYASYSTANDVSNLLVEFSPHALEASAITMKIDEDETTIWIGSEEQVRILERKLCVAKAREALRELTPEEYEALVQETSDPKFWQKT